MEIFGLAITFFSLVIAYQTWQNGRFMKEEMRSTKALLEKMDEHLVKMDEHLVRMDENNRIIWQKMDERTAKISEQIAKTDQKIEKISSEKVSLLRDK